MTANRSSSVVPKRRFPEFRHAPQWSTLRGDTLFDSINNRSAAPGLPVLAITQEHGAIPRDQIDYHVSVTAESVASYKEVCERDFIISLRSFQGGIEHSRHHGICSPAYVILRRKGGGDDDFFRHLFKSERFIQKLTRNIEGIRDGKMISYAQFSEQLLPVPAPPEQQKVADCLGSLDDVIAAEGRKLEALLQHKQGLMHRLFPQPGETVPRLRFPEFRTAADWSTETLGAQGRFLSSLTGKTAKDFGIGNAAFVPYMNVFSNAFTNTTDLRSVNVASDESQNAVAKGDVFFTVSSETPEDAGMSSVLLEEIRNCYLNSFCALFRFDAGQSPDPVFLGYLLRSAPTREHLSRGAQGATRYNISRSTFRSLPLLIPSRPEQKKVAHCLRPVDNLIAAVRRKLDSLRQQKRGLIQQLFASLESY